jgi:cold shock protein
MPVGVVKYFNDEKGYGFVEQEGGPDVFFHFSVIHMPGHKTLERGDRVEFEAAAAPKGLKATLVRRLGGQ